jgi:phage baseplate assembly protein W
MAVPHFRFPFRVSGGQVAVVEQDTFDEVAQCVQVVLSTPIGARIEVPTYGITDPVFSTDSNARSTAMLTAVGEWEPRADAKLDITVDNVDDYLHHITVELPTRTDDVALAALPLPESPDVEDSDGFGLGGWGIEPWGS